MANNTRELKPDIVLKNYWSDNEQFADLFNAVLFEGRQVIKPEELEEIDSEESTVLEHRKYAKSIKASRDNIKICKKSTKYGVELTMLGLENQEHIHYAMPMRLMGYDYGAYKKQYDSNARKYKTAEGINKDEFLSKMKKTDHFAPVITIVVYYGEKAWDGAVTLHEMLNIPEEMKEFVNDYKMRLVEARQNNLRLHNINNVDLFNLIAILLDHSKTRKEIMETAIKYGEEHKPDKSVIMTIAGAMNAQIDYDAFEKGGSGMRTVFEEIANEAELKGIEKGIEQGIEKGIEKGIEQGIEKGDAQRLITSVDNIMEKLSLSLEDGCALTGTTVKEYNDAVELLKEEKKTLE